MTAHDDRDRDEQPAPAGDDELREAESVLFGWVSDPHVDRVMTEYDERGRERDAARAVRRQLWQHLGRPDGVGLDVELIDAVADAVQSGRAARAEVERLGERLHAAQVRVAELELTPDERAEVERLRARDEKAKGVVQAWWGRRGVFEQGTELWAALDALARAHEDRADR